MAKRPLPDQATLLKLLRYDPISGKLWWRERSLDFFAHTSHPEVQWRRWNLNFAGKEALTALSSHGFQDGYRVGNILGQRHSAHRVIWCMVHGTWPDMIDHIDQNRSNNAIGNLRLADPITNGRNQRRSHRNTSGRTGVHFHAQSGKWRARIGVRNRKVYLGEFTTFDEACRAREAAEKRFGFDPRHGNDSTVVWHPIETARKGRTVLVFTRCSEVEVAYLSDDEDAEWRTPWGSDILYGVRSPTHWADLPAPPQDVANERKGTA